MKIKQRTICQSCRKGKIGCDGKKPACSQCIFRGLHCPGYSTDWAFVSHTPQNDAKVKAPRRSGARRQTGASVCPTLKEALRTCSGKPAILPTALPLNDLILTIIDNYVPESDGVILNSSVEPSPRICGSWVEVLPDIVSNGTDTALDTALASAIRAFAVTILSRGPKRRFPILEGLEAYNQALISVNDALQSRYNDFPVAIAAAVMCLLLAELFQATSLCSWAAHLQGLAELMQLSRPEAYVSGVPHRLFVGARPVLVVLAFFSRKSSFLAEEGWKTIPFREIAASPVQALMSEAAVIPSVLERMDAKGVSTVAEESLCAFKIALDRLDAWADEFHSSNSGSSPLFWFQPSAKGERSHIWFQNITAANALTHYWVFKVICLRNIKQLEASCRRSDSESVPDGGRSEEAKQLSVMICQSIEYLVQDRMKLFGPTSVPLLLRTAHEIFEAGGQQSKKELDWCGGIIGDIENRGYAFMSFFSKPWVTDGNNDQG